MHIVAQGDPPPDSEDYKSHVSCEHGGLALNPANRCRISTEAFIFLRSLFPAWQAMPGDLEPCLICDGLVNMGMEDRIEVRRRADDEKVHSIWLLIPSQRLILFLDQVETHA